MNFVGKILLLCTAIAVGLFAGASRSGTTTLQQPSMQQPDPGSKSLLCLLYHRFVDEAKFKTLSKSAQAYSITPSRFESHLRMLRESGFDSVALDDAIAFAKAKRDLPLKAVLITIDDGCESALTIAAPLLKKHGMTATLFVTTDPTAYVFGCAEERCDDPRLGRRQLREWCDMGFDIGSHGVTHRPLNQMSDEELVIELTKSRQKLRNLTGHEVTTLAAPRGRWDARVQRFAKAAGYDAMFTSNRGEIEVGNDVFALARRNVSGRWSNTRFRALVESTTFGRHAGRTTGR